VCAISGLISGAICRWNVCYVCDLIKVPKSIALMTNKLFGWLLESKVKVYVISTKILNCQKYLFYCMKKIKF
jgi:hypothetical protein